VEGKMNKLNAVSGFYKTLLEAYTPKQIALVKGLVQGHVDPSFPDFFPKTYKWIKSCYNEPTFQEKVMSAIDEVLETHGVEGFTINEKEVVEYCNTGDTYALTVVFFRGKLRATSYGDIIEKYDKKWRE